MRRVEKPWGHELIWAETSRYVGKILHITAGHKLSRQYHRKKEETFLIQAGSMDLEIGEPGAVVVHHMKVGDTFHCVPGTVHRMVAVSDVDVVEVSTPELDDVVRLEDAYGRQGTDTPLARCFSPIRGRCRRWLLAGYLCSPQSPALASTPYRRKPLALTRWFAVGADWAGLALRARGRGLRFALAGDWGAGGATFWAFCLCRVWCLRGRRWGRRRRGRRWGA